MRTLSVTVSPEMDGRQVKSILRRELSMAEGFIARVKLRPEGITLNGLRCRTVDRVRVGDVLRVQVGDGPAKCPFQPIACPLDIVYEDEDIIVLNKAPGMACHGNTRKDSPTLGNALAHYLPGVAFHPVNRLDKGTSGLMLLAKSGYVHELLRRSLHSESLRREYLLVCSPPPPKEEGCIDLPIGRLQDSPTKRCVSDDGSPAQTDYRVLGVWQDRALVRACLRTGRTHQIRVHFSAIGSPLVGDLLYGSPSAEIARPALHSALLDFVHPLSGEKLSFSLPMPEDMQKLTEKG